MPRLPQPSSAPLLAALLIALAGCMGASADGDAQADGTGASADASAGGSDGANASADAANTGGDGASSGSTTTTDGSPATSSSDDGRPPASGVSGGRETVRETLVVVQPLAIGPIRDEIVVSSRVESDASVQVFPKLSNLPVTDVRVHEGDLVAAGDVLMTLYARELELALDAAGTSRDRSQKEVEQAALRLTEEKARVVRAERQAQKTAADLERLEGLVVDGLVNIQEVEDARLTAETSTDDLELSRFARDGAQLALDLAGLALAGAEIEVSRARSDLEHATVRAPLAGIVAVRDVEVGELSSLSRAAFRIVALDRPVLNLRVPQDALARLGAGQRVEVRAVTDVEARFDGTVRTVNPVLDEVTGTIHVIVDLLPEPGLVPGLFCEARVVTAERGSALLIDKRAVRYDDDQPLFFALADDQGSVRRVPFRAGASTATAIEILSDLEGGPVASALRVVVVGHESLKDGARVRVQEEAY